MTVDVNSSGRFEPLALEPGAPGAYACFGTWENLGVCQPLLSGGSKLQGCSQSVECRVFTMERNPPTTRFRARPRRDGRFEIQQFREFIQERTTYQLDVEPGEIVVTYPGDRKVPKSQRFFLHTKHVEDAGLAIDEDLVLILALDRMVVRQAGNEPERAPRRAVILSADDAESRRARIRERLKERARAAVRDDSSDDIEDMELDFDLELEVEEAPKKSRKSAAPAAKAPAASPAKAPHRVG